MSLSFMAHDKFHWLPLVLAAFWLISGCGDKPAEQAAGNAHGPAGGPHGNGDPGHPPQQATPVAISPTTTGSIASYYKATATLEAEKSAQILSRATGLVEEILVEEGDQVAEGAPLLSIDNHQYKLRVDQTVANTANLRARFQRFEAMRAEDLTTEEEYQAAASELASAEADEGLARLEFSYTTVRAPFSGSVTQRLIDPGNNVSVGTPLFTMSDFTPLLARVHVPSREFNKLKQNQIVDLVLDSSRAQLTGRIKLISPVIDATSGTIKLTIEVQEYPVGTRPGDFAEVQIVTEKRDDTLLVPRAAVITEKGETFVYVPVESEAGATAERRLVQVGFTDDLHTEILSGLTSGESVVSKGQRSLKNGAPLKILDAQPGAQH